MSINEWTEEDYFRIKELREILDTYLVGGKCISHASISMRSTLRTIKPPFPLKELGEHIEQVETSINRGHDAAIVRYTYSVIIKEFKSRARFYSGAAERLGQFADLDYMEELDNTPPQYTQGQMCDMQHELKELELRENKDMEFCDCCACTCGGCGC